MKSNFIYSTNYYDAFKDIIAKINGRKVDISVRHLLIVPERYTLLAEKYLYANCDGSFDIEVLSPSRLFYKMQIKTPLLSREGAIMLIRGMLPKISLSCFYRSASCRGFCEKLYDAINDFAANGIAPKDIPTSSPKLADLKAVYAEYLNRISGRFVDSMGKLELIAKNAKQSEYLNNVHIYVANFDYVDKATRNVFDALKDRSISYTEAVIKGDAPVCGAALKYCGEGATAVKEVAKRIRLAAYNGTKYEDMAIICGNADGARIKRILTEFDIPCFMAESKRLIDYSLSSFLLKLFECAQRKNRDSFVELAKNVYSGVDKQSSDLFENYVNSRLIDYKGFFEPFKDGDPCCELTRQRLTRLCLAVERRIKTVDSAQNFGELVNEIFSLISAEKTTVKLYDSDAPVQKVKALCSLMEQVCIDGSFEFISAVFAEGLKASKVSTIPYSGGVTVGDPASFRGGKYAFMAVIGFDDEFLPQIYDDSSLIGDDEKSFFTQMERAEQINLRYEQELKLALGSADNIFITYTSPSGMMSELFGDTRAVNSDDYDDILLTSGSKRHAMELLVSLVGKMENKAEDNQQLVNVLFEATQAKDELFVFVRKDSVLDGEKLFFPRGSTSVSQLQSYFSCPFRHYLEYGLRLKERDKGELTPLDVGSFMHLIVEAIVKKGDYSDIKKSVDNVVDEILACGGKLSLDGNKDIVEMLKKEATAAMTIYASHLNKGKFKPLGQEIEFESSLDGINIYGKIDMADVCGDYVRLIDYKTGNHELKSADIYYGQKIQLPLYMAAISQKGYKKAAIMNFPFSYSWLGGKLDHRFSGFALKDDFVMDAIDSTRSEGESEVFNLKIDRNDSVLNHSEMENLIDYSVKLSEKAVAEIKDGYVAASPCNDVCKYCSYGCVCTCKKERTTQKITKANFGEC